MHITRIAVDAWRGLSCELNDLSPGLNLICGPNESGKSRLVQALRFALFESSSGKARHKKSLETWGATDGKPRVEVAFELNGASWLLEKTFLGTGCNTVLRGAGKTLDGEEAEARLADLMGVSQGGTAELKSSERGIWSLLWVDQGQSADAPSHNPVSQSRIQDQLTAEIGEVAAGETGQRILKQAEEYRNQFYTASRDAERAVLRDARDTVAQAQASLDEARGRHLAVARDADELEALRRREQDLKQRVAETEARRSEIAQRHTQAAEAEKHLDRARHQVELAKLELERRQQAWDGFTELSSQIARLDAEIDALQSARNAAEAAREQAAAAHAEAAQRVAEADDALAVLGERLRALRQRQKLTALAAERAQLETRLDEAGSLTARIAAIRSELAELPAVSAEDVDRLRQATQTVEAARARLEGASASVELRALRDLRLDGAPLPAGDARTVLVEDEKQLEVEGVVSILVRPGGGDLARLRDALSDAERGLAGLLMSLAVEDVQQADRTAQARRDLTAELQRVRDARGRHLPEGPDEVEARVREIGALLGAAGDAERGASARFDAGELEHAEARERDLAAARDSLRTQRDARDQALREARDNDRELEIQINGKRQQRAGLAEDLTRMPDAAALQQQLETARRTWGERVAARDAAHQRYEDLGGEQLELDLRQAQQALKQLRDSHRNVQDTCLGLETRLGLAGDDARYERVLDLEADLNQATAELDRLTREAHAARRLYEVLNEEYRGARERLSQPVVARIRPYLADLFPGSEVWLDEEMNLLGMRGSRVEEDFDALSGGAREQLSLLVRIGLAEVIGAEESWPLVLDDVLVNTDAERIKRVQRLLYQAARNMQILLFTCHGPLFDMLGPDQRIELTPVIRRPAPSPP